MATRKSYRRERKKKSIFLRIALAVFAIYAVVMLIQLQMEISAKEKTLSDMQTNASQLAAANDDMEQQLKNPDQIQEQNAYEDGYIHQGQEVYVETPK